MDWQVEKLLSHVKYFWQDLKEDSTIKYNE